ncbi:MAG: cation transporter, partial [Chitinophagales bacterium]|nr:cation transporter [Chitinophagales bacterium]
MKNLFRSFLQTIFLIGFLSVLVSAVADPKNEKIVFKSSIVCKMCKTKLEQSISKIDGVLNALVNISFKTVSVKYDPRKTNVEEIRKVVLQAGYSYNDDKPTAEAFEKLPSC